MFNGLTFLPFNNKFNVAALRRCSFPPAVDFLSSPSEAGLQIPLVKMMVASRLAVIFLPLGVPP